MYKYMYKMHLAVTRPMAWTNWMGGSILKRGWMSWLRNPLEFFPISYEHLSLLYLEQLHQKNLFFMAWDWGLNCSIWCNWVLPLNLPLWGHTQLSQKESLKGDALRFWGQITFSFCTALTWEIKQVSTVQFKPFGHWIPKDISDLWNRAA